MIVIYCADGNKRFAQIAIDSGMEYGARLPGKTYHPIYFADQNWKNPNREKYMAQVAEKKPHMATVLDLERKDQYNEVLDWASEITNYVQVVIIVPKVKGITEKLPREINGKEIRLGYSVPTRYGATHISQAEFYGWPIHLLGGSPEKQMLYCGINLRIPDAQLSFDLDLPRLNVKSIDGNMILGQATRHCQFWCPGNAKYAQNKFWPTVREWNDGNPINKDAPYLAFRMSCENIMKVWNEYDI